MKQRLFLLAVLLIVNTVIRAELILPSIIGDNMVLQQQTNAKLWGRSDANSKVSITTSWDQKTTIAMSGKDGKWVMSVATPTVGGPYKMKIQSGKDKIIISNILIGEVWFCSGQSNMEMPMKGFAYQPVEGASDVIISAKPSTQIRICTVSRSTSKTMQDDVKVKWMTNTSEAVANASATAYFFAQRLNKTLDVPVGIIVSNWGGTPVQAWMSRQAVSKHSLVDLSFLEKNNKLEKPQNYPTMLYNTMVAPLENYNVKGFLWYQGESNRKNSELYRSLMKSYVEMMRQQWGSNELPFYYVQIAPYVYNGRDSIEAARLREVQLFNLKDIPNSGMVVTADIGDERCIHPAKKKEVGDRLAYLALKEQYGIKGIDPRSPIYKSIEIKGNRAIVTFHVDKNGIAPLGQPLSGFEIAGQDKVFYPADAMIDRSNGDVVVSCKSVSKPVAVRYGYKNSFQASLYNCYGIPASPFRTDNW